MKYLVSLLLTIIITVSAITSSTALLVSAEGEYTQPEKFIYGDVNQDLEVNVKDVTYIQKGLAEIHYVNAVQRFLADPEGEGFSIKNATAIQKFLAKYEVSPLLGTELPMASQDEFSTNISLEDMYFGNFVSVRPISSLEFSCEYTLDDFPEYKFSKIEKFGSEEWGFVTYLLYLEEPGKENLIEAVKALDYRANLDLQDAHPDDYAVSG